jgi:integrase
MARTIHKLTPLAVSKIARPGLYGDGAGLYLQVGPTGGKSWLFRFMLRGRAREMGLGPLHTVNLTEARACANECRKLRLAGKDPIEERDSAEVARRLQAAKSMTFKECAQAYIETHRIGWKNAKHASQWENTLRDYVYPTIGQLPVAAVDTDLVVKCLSPIWTKKTETATRVRARIESILDWATTSKYRQGENPARWRGHLENLLATPGKVAKKGHHSALPYLELPAFMAALRAQAGVSARALEFAVLTATRTSEVIGATWDEFDLERKLWTVPADRMKAKKEHRVPLSPRAVEVLRVMQELHGGRGIVFPGVSGKKPLSNMALLMTLRRMERNDITAHGFRSTFRDWAAEMTAYPRDVAEMALAHTISDKVEAAYRRGDLFTKRQQMMDEWAGYCGQEESK